MLAQQIQLHKHASKSPAISTRLWCGYWSCSGLWERGTQCRFYCCVLPQIEQIIAKTRTPIMPCCAPSYDSCTTIIWLWGRCNKEKKKKKKKTREGANPIIWPEDRSQRIVFSTTKEATQKPNKVKTWVDSKEPTYLQLMLQTIWDQPAPPSSRPSLKALAHFIGSPYSQEEENEQTRFLIRLPGVAPQ